MNWVLCFVKTFFNKFLNGFFCLLIPVERWLLSKIMESKALTTSLRPCVPPTINKAQTFTRQITSMLLVPQRAMQRTELKFHLLVEWKMRWYVREPKSLMQLTALLDSVGLRWTPSTEVKSGRKPRKMKRIEKGLCSEMNVILESGYLFAKQIKPSAAEQNPDIKSQKRKTRFYFYPLSHKFFSRKYLWATRLPKSLLSNKKFHST